MQAPKDAHDCAPRQAKNILEHLHGPKRMTVTGVHVVTFSMTDDDNTTLGGGGRGGYRDYGGSLFPGAVLIYWRRKSPSFDKGHFDKGWKQTWIEADEGGTLHHVKLEEETKCWKSKHQHDRPAAYNRGTNDWYSPMWFFYVVCYIYAKTICQSGNYN